MGLVLALALALVLLLAQFLGQTHGIAHSHGLMHQQLHDHGQAQAQAKEQTQEQGGLNVFAHLFSGHDDDSADCHAFDQLSHIDAMAGVDALVLPLVIQPFLLAISSGLATARWHALFQARGPPPLR